MPQPDPDMIDIGELRRLDLAERRKRRALDDDDSDFAFIPPLTGGTPDILGALIAGTVFVMAAVGVFATLRFALGLFL